MNRSDFRTFFVLSSAGFVLIILVGSLTYTSSCRNTVFGNVFGNHYSASIPREGPAAWPGSVNFTTYDIRSESTIPGVIVGVSRSNIYPSILKFDGSGSQRLDEIIIRGDSTGKVFASSNMMEPSRIDFCFWAPGYFTTSISYWEGSARNLYISRYDSGPSFALIHDSSISDGHGRYVIKYGSYAGKEYNLRGKIYRVDGAILGDPSSWISLNRADVFRISDDVQIAPGVYNRMNAYEIGPDPSTISIPMIRSDWDHRVWAYSISGGWKDAASFVPSDDIRREVLRYKDSGGTYQWGLDEWWNK